MAADTYRQHSVSYAFLGGHEPAVSLLSSHEILLMSNVEEQQQKHQKCDFSQQEFLTVNDLSVCLNLNLYFLFIHLILYYILLFCHVALK